MTTTSDARKRLAEKAALGHFEAAIEARDELVAARAALAEKDAEIERLRACVDQQERDHLQTIDDRDRIHEIADRLAYSIAPMEVIGEHSSGNSPWHNALDARDPIRAERDAAFAQLAKIASWLNSATSPDVFRVMVHAVITDPASAFAKHAQGVRR